MGLRVASNNPRLRCPRIGYARLLIAENSPNHSTIPDPQSVITLGQRAKQPLIGPSSELSYGLEPHALFDSRAEPAVTVTPSRQWEGCTRGGSAGWVPWRGYTGYYPAVQIEA